jgi:hypothetical protein
LDERAILLLEEIAWRLHGNIKEKAQYLKELYAQAPQQKPQKQDDRGILKHGRK